MRGFKVALILLIMLAFSASASALSMPSLFGSLASFPTLSTNGNLLNSFSFGTNYGNSAIAGNPRTDMYSVSSKGSSTPTIHSILGNPSNPIQYSTAGLDSGFQWPGAGFKKWTANGVAEPTVTAPATIATTKSDSAVQAYYNAPAITPAQKDEAIKIAATSPLCKQYDVYPDESYKVEWNYPYDGHTVYIQMNPEFTYDSPHTGLEFTVDLNTGTIVNTKVVNEPYVIAPFWT